MSHIEALVLAVGLILLGIAAASAAPPPAVAAVHLNADSVVWAPAR